MNTSLGKKILILDQKNMADKQALTDFFNYVDTDKNGLITVAEIHAACDIDINGDGTIDATEQQEGSGPWLAVLAVQDLNDPNQQLTLAELLAYNGITN